ncbi:hypothetical protein N406_07745 [Helicobacter pylori FD577]|nr:hypothetical protein N406_07745 [Helicobacter pylori FD577]
MRFSWLSDFILKNLAKNIACYNFALFVSPKYSSCLNKHLQIPNNSGVVFTSFSRTTLRSQENLNLAITKKLNQGLSGHFKRSVKVSMD